MLNIECPCRHLIFNPIEDRNSIKSLRGCKSNFFIKNGIPKIMYAVATNDKIKIVVNFNKGMNNIKIFNDK